MTTHEAPPANRQDLFNTLAYLTGHLVVATSRDEHAVDALHDELSRAPDATDLATAKDRYFSVESSDLFFADAVAPQQRSRLTRLAERMAARHHARRSCASSCATCRCAPRRCRLGPAMGRRRGGCQDPGAVPQQGWAPRLVRLLQDHPAGRALCAGRPDPAILFNVSLAKKFPHTSLPPVVDALTVYHLIPDSVWINSALLAPNAPAGLFTGLKIKGGTITLSAPPQLVNGKLTLAARTKATVALDLDPTALVDADPASPYGIDARKATMHLPGNCAFHFSGGGAPGSTPSSATSTGRCTDSPPTFGGTRRLRATFDALLNRVLIPLDCSVNRFTISDCASPFTTFAGAADVERGAWALPVAQIDVTKPSPAAGIGGLAVRCKKGLTAQWQGLQGGAVNLPNPWLLSDPGRLNFTDLQAGNVFCTQDYLLWKDDLNPYGSTVKLNLHRGVPVRLQHVRQRQRGVSRARQCQSAPGSTGHRHRAALRHSLRRIPCSSSP